MDFDVKRVYTAANAHDAKIGSIGHFADTYSKLQEYVRFDKATHKLTSVRPDNCVYRFCMENKSDGWSMFYLVDEPKKERLCTYAELAKWLAQGHGVYSYRAARSEKACFTDFGFPERLWNTEVPAGTYLVRKWEDTELHEPTLEYMGVK